MRYRPGDEPVEGYKLIRVLGRGGFGVVWLAEGPGGIPIAVKVIDLTMGRGRKELRAIQRVKSIVHPNLVPIQGLWLVDHQGRVLDEGERQSIETSLQTVAFDRSDETVAADQSAGVEEGPDELIIAMGLAEKTLSQRLAECKKEGLTGIPPGELLRYMEDAARAIDYLNSKTHDIGSGDQEGIQHGDIKPGNLLIVGGAVQVCDFGLARLLRDSSKTTIAYTPAYAAPETITLNKPSQATDQYSLAVTYLELRCGKLPFDSDSHYLIAKAHTEGAVDLSALPPSERSVIAKATSVDPDERYGSASEMIAALQDVVGGDSLPDSRAVSDHPDEVLTEIVTECKPLSAGDEGLPQTVSPNPASRLSVIRHKRSFLIAFIAIAFVIGFAAFFEIKTPPPWSELTVGNGETYDGKEFGGFMDRMIFDLENEPKIDEVLARLEDPLSKLDMVFSTDGNHSTDIKLVRDLHNRLQSTPIPTEAELERYKNEIDRRKGLGCKIVELTLELILENYSDYKDQRESQSSDSATTTEPQS